MEHLRPNPINYPERYLGSVLGRINVHAKWPLAEWRIHNLDDGFRNSANVGVGGHDSAVRRRLLGARWNVTQPGLGFRTFAAIPADVVLENPDW
jgi:hypothetical protein